MNALTFERALVVGDPSAAIASVTRMGRVMLAVARHGITHERIGAVEMVQRVDHTLRLGGSAHDAVIDLSALKANVADRTPRMGSRALPRFQALGHDGAILFALIALDGLAAFDGAADELAFDPSAAPTIVAAPQPVADASGEGPDPGGLALERAAAKPGIAQLRFVVPGVRQRWSGSIGTVLPAMGFLNVIQADFHLHLRAGAIGGWHSERSADAQVLQALDPSGAPLGLFLEHADVIDLD